MPRARFEQTIWIHTEAQRVREALTSLADHTSLHPLIVRVEELADAGPRRRFRITDRVPLGSFRMTVRYLAETGVDADGAVDTDAWQEPGVHLHVVTRLTDQDGGVRLDERVEITAPWGLTGYVRAQALAAHRQLFARLKQALEGSPTPRA